jgi:hypothetical protein
VRTRSILAAHPDGAVLGDAERGVPAGSIDALPIRANRARRTGKRAIVGRAGGEALAKLVVRVQPHADARWANHPTARAVVRILRGVGATRPATDPLQKTVRPEWAVEPEARGKCGAAIDRGAILLDVRTDRSGGTDCPKRTGETAIRPRASVVRGRALAAQGTASSAVNPRWGAGISATSARSAVEAAVKIGSVTAWREAADPRETRFADRAKVVSIAPSIGELAPTESLVEGEIASHVGGTGQSAGAAV